MPTSLARVLCVCFLTCLSLTACRDPASTASALVPDPKNPPTPHAVENPETSLRLNPPIVEGAQVIPLAANQTEGAILRVAFGADKRLGDSIELQLADKPVVLKRTKDGPQTFEGQIDFDWNLLTQEMATVSGFQRESKPPPVFVRRTATRVATFSRQLDVALVKSSLATRQPFDLPHDVFKLGWLFIDTPRELMITSTNVVEDPLRTFDPCTGAGTAGGAWTFGKLMTDMANQSVSSLDPSDFVEDWAKTWLTDQPNLNGDITVPKRAAMQTILNNWPKLASGKLDLNKAPFRLLAIVNRIDLRTNNAYGGGDAGEGRFVFGLVNQSATGTCPAGSQAQFTVILEYGVPIKGCSAVSAYAAQWKGLGNIALGDAAFNTALEAVTNVFTAAGAGGAKPNGSAINQIRTNEIALAGPWDLREFQVDAASHKLSLRMPVKQPRDSLRNQAVIRDLITANAASIANGTFQFPDKFPGTTSFRAGQALNNLAAWKGDTNDPALSDARHQFSLDTCDACHGGEALDTTVGTGQRFLHIRPRAAGAASDISLFLKGDGTLESPSMHEFPDPLIPANTRAMGDLQRRRVDLASLDGSCKASGILRELTFRPLLMSH